MSLSSIISALYESILGRAADPSGLAGYIGAVGNGDSLAQIATAIASSPESQANLQTCISPS